MGADKKMKKANTGLQTVDNKKIAEFVTLRKIFKCKIINEIFFPKVEKSLRIANGGTGLRSRAGSLRNFL